ncbi:MAG: DUF1905 domain-containing protein [Candidatus Eremiobacteraeota bacterium]|nr:DUF1905 domain-containing protein [Candidatus Eremiobacteraeota bacterium]
MSVETVVVGTIEKPDVPGAVCRIAVPTAEVVRTFGRRGRVAVVATFEGGYAMRSSLVPRGGAHVLPLSAEVRRAAKLPAEGERVTVALREDVEPRTVDVPAALLAALDEAGVRAAFEAMSYSHRKEWVLAVEAAKRPETRLRRIADCVAALRARGA